MGIARPVLVGSLDGGRRGGVLGVLEGRILGWIPSASWVEHRWLIAGAAR